MSTSLPMLMPTQATGSGDPAALPVNTAVADSSQAFANVLGSHFQPDGMAVDVLPEASLMTSSLMPMLSVSSIDGQNLPLDLSQLSATDGNGLPFSPELMWSGMLIMNDTNTAGPQLYQLSPDGQTLTSQVDPNLLAQINQAMNRQPTSANTNMPAMLNISGVAITDQPGISADQSVFFTASGISPMPGTSGIDAGAAQRLAEAFPKVLLNTDSDSMSAWQSADKAGDIQNLQMLGMSATGEKSIDRFHDMVQLQMSGSPKNPAWAQGIGERVQWLIQQNIQGAEIRLNPPELGLLEVKVKLNSDQATQIQFTSPNGSVREALEAAIPRLREMFAEAGLSLGDVNISHQSLAEQQQNGQSGDNSDGKAAARIASVDAGNTDENNGPNQLISEGLVDMYV